MVLVVMRRLPLSICAALLLLSALADQAVARTGSSGAPCPPPHAEQLLSDSQADIYLTFKVDESFAYGCLFGRKHSYPLGLYDEKCEGSAEAGCAGIAHVTLSGTMVAYEENNNVNVSETSSYRIVARSLRSGRVLHRVLAGARPGIGGATALVAKGNGSLAWIVEVEEENENTGAPAVYEVRAVDKSGVRVLASGPGIAPNSLALAGGTVYWTQGGKPASTILH